MRLRKRDVWARGHRADPPPRLQWGRGMRCALQHEPPRLAGREVTAGRSARCGPARSCSSLGRRVLWAGGHCLS